MNTESRKIEAERIATAEGYAIKEHSDDWTFFVLDDTIILKDGPASGMPCTTFFTWYDWRFEGAVSLSR